MGERLQSCCGIIIPVYQNSQFLPTLLNRLKLVCAHLPHWTFQTVIVDDGSQPPLLPLRVEGMSIVYRRHERNLGKGAALKTGFHYLIHRPEVEVILTMDGDLQHPPEAIVRFLQIYQLNGADFIYGYRPRRLGQMPAHRILSNHLTSLIISLMTGRICRDSQCGFRLYRKDVLQNVVMCEDGFHLESELALRLGWRKVTMAWVPIPVIYHRGPSAIRNVTDTFHFIRVVVKLIIQRWMGYV